MNTDVDIEKAPDDIDVGEGVRRQRQGAKASTTAACASAKSQWDEQLIGQVRPHGHCGVEKNPCVWDDFGSDGFGAFLSRAEGADELGAVFKFEVQQQGVSRTVSMHFDHFDVVTTQGKFGKGRAHRQHLAMPNVGRKMGNQRAGAGATQRTAVRTRRTRRARRVRRARRADLPQRRCNDAEPVPRTGLTLRTSPVPLLRSDLHTRPGAGAHLVPWPTPRGARSFGRIRIGSGFAQGYEGLGAAMCAART